MMLALGEDSLGTLNNKPHMDERLSRHQQAPDHAFPQKSPFISERDRLVCAESWNEFFASALKEAGIPDASGRFVTDFP